MPKCSTSQKINPKTGRCIKIGGPTDRKLNGVSCKSGYKVNPKTGRCIKIGGPTDQKIGGTKRTTTKWNTTFKNAWDKLMKAKTGGITEKQFVKYWGIAQKSYIKMGHTQYTFRDLVFEQLYSRVKSRRDLQSRRILSWIKFPNRQNAETILDVDEDKLDPIGYPDNLVKFTAWNSNGYNAAPFTEAKEWRGQLR